jgi:hypothetical protein
LTSSAKRRSRAEVAYASDPDNTTVAAPFMARAMRRAIRKDLRRLAEILQRPVAAPLAPSSE